MRKLEHKERFFDRIDEAIADIQREGYHLHLFCHKELEEIGPHRHPVDETLYLLQGKLVFLIEGEPKPHTLLPGAKFVIPRCVMHAVTADTGTEYLMGWDKDISWEQFDDERKCKKGTVKSLQTRSQRR
jgi:quercetin dioxygenase-like cupin family protein